MQTNRRKLFILRRWNESCCNQLNGREDKMLLNDVINQRIEWTCQRADQRRRAKMYRTIVRTVSIFGVAFILLYHCEIAEIIKRLF